MPRPSTTVETDSNEPTHMKATPALNLIPLAACSLLTALSSAADEAPAADKSKYHLFNPTPKEAMREMSTDRPDKTESAYTVDAGHFQIESDLLSYSHDREDGVTTDAYSFAPVNLKVGLCNWSDLQLVLETFNYVETKSS